MTEEETGTFFLRYADAFENFDAERIANCFNLPAMILGATGAGVFQNRQELIGNFDAVNANHRSIGFNRAELIECTVAETPAPSVVQVSTTWRFLNEAGIEIYCFPMEYVMCRYLDGWKISVALNLGS